MVEDFAHLHVHTEYSLLDGHSRIRKLVQQAKALGMSHLAITDHGAMYGALEFYQACRAEGIHPILGVESYLVEDHTDRPVFQRKKQENPDGHTKRYCHQLLLAQNDVGYYNLIKLLSIANTQGMHAGKARIDKKLLEQYGEGIIATSSCLGGEIPQLIQQGKMDQAYRSARWYQQTFGPNHFYLEVQDHHGYPEQSPVNHALYQMSRDLHIPLVATNDLHYVEEGDADAHETLLCIQTQHRRYDPNRFRFNSHDFFLRSPRQMGHLFPEFPEALHATVEIAERCIVNPYARKASFPSFTLPEPYTSPSAYLYALCVEGIHRCYGQMSEPIRARLQYEFTMIEQKGFIPYFLIVGDFVGWARAQGIRCLARGSAAGSIMAYALGITNVDPLRFDLPFERFFNVERADMPDIDMDFADDRREEVIAYLVRTYGVECVAQMATFVTMAAKGAIRDVARAYDDRSTGNRISNLIREETLHASLEMIPDLSNLYSTESAAQTIFDMALQLEGVVKSTGVHAAGVVIANEPLDSFVPMQMREGRYATQYEQCHLEQLGLIKFDILGLKNLTVIDDVLKRLKERDIDLCLESLPLEEVCGDEGANERRRRAYELLAKGETIKIFQLEGDGMKNFLIQLQPSRIEDIMAMIALYRPGPIESIPDFIAAKHGRRHIVYLDPRLEQWLAESYGVIVYQDQVLQICVGLARFTWGQANKFRKALSKKILPEVESYRNLFIEGCIANGVAGEVARQLFELIKPFGGYGFNKAHAASYAVVAYYTAYLKANYPVEYMAAALSASGSDERIALLVAECKRLGIEVLRPNIQKSMAHFTIEDGGIRFGLLAIKGIGAGPIEAMISERVRAPYTSFVDVCLRIQGKSILETLVMAGALDDFGKRSHLLTNIDRAMRWGATERQALERGQQSLFGFDNEENHYPFTFDTTLAQELSHQLLLHQEHEVLGVYLSDHPLSHFAPVLLAALTHTSSQIPDVTENQCIAMAGMITAVKPIQTSKGESMCILTLEDLEGECEITVFPRTYTKVQSQCTVGRIVSIHGRTQIRRDKGTMSIICDDIRSIEQKEPIQKLTWSMLWLTIVCPEHDNHQGKVLVQSLYDLLHKHPGTDRFEIIVSAETWTVRLTPQENTCAYSPTLDTHLRALLGHEQVKIVEQSLALSA